jgi:UDP-glucose:(heptosyl)LPS alpha-1,3-glucosyltransferase
MRIGIIRKRYTFHGGAEKFSQSFIEKLAAKGHEIHVFAIEWQKDNTAGNIYFHKIPAVTCNSFVRDLTFAASSFFILKKHRKQLDIIQSHDRTLYQDIYRSVDGCHIEWLRQRWMRIGPWKKISIVINPYHWLVLGLESMIFRGHRYKKIVAISEFVKRLIMKHYRVDGKDIEVIYNGVDIERFNPGNRALYRKEVRNKYALNDGDFVILFVGSGFERKGVKYLLSAVELIEEPLTVLIVGRGPESKFAKFVKKQRVIFCGPQGDIHKYYAASDIFVFPTIYEPFGNVHLEALASGLPVITTRLSGASEIIRDNVQGFVVDRPEDIRKIAEGIRLLMNGDERLRMSLEARRLSEQFSFEGYIAKMLELYDSIEKSQ